MLLRDQRERASIQRSRGATGTGGRWTAQGRFACRTWDDAHGEESPAERLPDEVLGEDRGSPKNTAEAKTTMNRRNGPTRTSGTIRTSGGDVHEDVMIFAAARGQEESALAVAPPELTMPPPARSLAAAPPYRSTPGEEPQTRGPRGSRVSHQGSPITLKEHE